ncbi:hypothetical protein LY76DRAFT_136011 [Colletotrichum caudatum]|nr:hypothetical protein LY76DRAFT_136011 [Colletotrichum caudatum]
MYGLSGTYKAPRGSCHPSPTLRNTGRGIGRLAGAMCDNAQTQEVASARPSRPARHRREARRRRSPRSRSPLQKSALTTALPDPSYLAQPPPERDKTLPATTTGLSVAWKPIKGRASSPVRERVRRRDARDPERTCSPARKKTRVAPDDRQKENVPVRRHPLKKSLESFESRLHMLERGGGEPSPSELA